MMARTTVSYSFAKEELQDIKNKMLNWLSPFSIFAYLDNNGYNNEPNRFELLVGAGTAATYDVLPDKNEDWLFGHLGYDYKNVIEPRLASRHTDKIGFADSFFFRPEIVVCIPFGQTTISISVAGNLSAQVVLDTILAIEPIIRNALPKQSMNWQYRFSHTDYVRSIEQIRAHIKEGDCYELNFCSEAFTEQQNIDPVYHFAQLNRINPSPFAALYRNGTSWLMCASPERFIFREGDGLVSQPIKGTAGRSSDVALDHSLKAALLQNEKERAENVMIVDLVRNDLARSCQPGSVAVPELFGVYTFPQVHQLISTVTGKVKADISNKDILHNAFPMGSMTGAPKVMVMELIDEYERTRRGIYAGTVGYLTPEGDFDFNVVIRSLMYNSNTGYLSYQTGGAITYDSVAQQEWEEVRLKARAMEQVFF